MHRGVHGADTFARRIFAVLTGHRLIHHLRVIDPFLGVLLVIAVLTFILNESRGCPGIVIATSVVAINSQPVHLTAFGHLILADNRNVVLALAGNHTGIAASAGAEINGHAPLMHVARQTRPLFIRMLIDRPLIAGVGTEAHMIHKIGVLAEFLQCRLANDRPTFH